MTDIPLNTYIEWTDADRERGKCPVPDGSVVTLWYSYGGVRKTYHPESFNWEEIKTFPPIIGYMVHELPREPFAVWAVVDTLIDLIFTLDKDYAEACVKEYGGLEAYDD